MPFNRAQGPAILPIPDQRNTKLSTATSWLIITLQLIYHIKSAQTSERYEEGSVLAPASFQVPLTGAELIMAAAVNIVVRVG